jgi:hypothetical protein
VVARVAGDCFDGAGNQTWVAYIQPCSSICKILHGLLLRIKCTLVSEIIRNLRLAWRKSNGLFLFPRGNSNRPRPSFL